MVANYSKLKFILWRVLYYRVISTQDPMWRQHPHKSETPGVTKRTGYFLTEWLKRRWCCLGSNQEWEGGGRVGVQALEQWIEVSLEN